MNIGFIGAGKVGTSFGRYLKINGFNVIGYYSKTYESAIKAANFTKTKAFKKLHDFTENSEIIFITTNDDNIKSVCDKLVQGKLICDKHIIVHMSGASSSLILLEAQKLGAHVYSMHPIQSFADVNKAVKDLKNTFFSIEGDEENIHILEDMLKKLGNRYFRLKPEDKSLYHASACIISNYLVTLINIGLETFEKFGVGKEDAFKAIYPLINSTINNIGNLGPEKALTGPIARGDINTIKNHLDSISKLSNDLFNFYSCLGLKTVDLAEKNKLKDKSKIDEFRRLFEEVE